MTELMMYRHVTTSEIEDDEDITYLPPEERSEMLKCAVCGEHSGFDPELYYCFIGFLVHDDCELGLPIPLTEFGWNLTEILKGKRQWK